MLSDRRDRCVGGRRHRCRDRVRGSSFCPRTVSRGTLDHPRRGLIAIRPGSVCDEVELIGRRGRTSRTVNITPASGPVERLFGTERSTHVRYQRLRVPHSPVSYTHLTLPTNREV